MNYVSSVLQVLGVELGLGLVPACQFSLVILLYQQSEYHCDNLQVSVQNTHYIFYEYREFIGKIRMHREWIFLEMHIFNIGFSEQVYGKGLCNMKHSENAPITLNVHFLRVHYHRSFIPVSYKMEYSLSFSQAFNYMYKSFHCCFITTCRAESTPSDILSPSKT